MAAIKAISLVALALMCGCIHGKGGDKPIVAPTVITNEVQDASDPVLPPYKPWWVKE